MLEEKDLEKITELFRNLFSEGIEQLILPHFDGIYQRLDRVENRLDKVDGRLDKVEERLDKVEEQLTFLTAEMKIVKEYVLSHQEEIEDFGDRTRILEENGARK